MYTPVCTHTTMTMRAQRVLYPLSLAAALTYPPHGPLIYQSLAPHRLHGQVSALLTCDEEELCGFDASGTRRGAEDPLMDERFLKGGTGGQGVL